MPQIPTIGTPSALGMDQAQPSSGVATIQGADAVGNAMAGFGQDVTRAAAMETDRLNRVQAQNAINTLDQRSANLEYGQATDPNDPTTGGFRLVTGSAALNPKAPILDTYGTRFDDQVNDIGSGLSGAALQMFNEQAQAKGTQFKAQLLQHTMEQANTFTNDTNTNTIAQAQGTVAANPSPLNLAVSNSALSNVYASIAQEHGTEAAQKIIGPARSALYATAVTSLIQQNRFADAQALFNASQSNMTADDITHTRAQLVTTGDKVVGIQSASTGVQPLRNWVQPTPTNTFANVIRSQETGQSGDTKPDGTPVLGAVLDDGTQAKYAMQVRPATATDANYLKPLGVTPAANDSAAEYDRVGTQMANALLVRYGGDPAKAAAAYTAGYGAVDRAVTDKGADWMQDLGPKTQAYALAAQQAMQNPPPVTIPSQLAYDNAAVAQLPPGASPQTREAALAESKRQYEEDMQNYSVQKENATAQYQQALMHAQGNLNAVAPGTVQNYLAYNPGGQPAMRQFADAVNPMTNPTTNMAAFASVLADPKQMATWTPSQVAQFRLTQIAPEDRAKFDDLHSAAMGNPSTAPTSLDTGALNFALNNRLTAMGLNDTTKTGSAKAAQAQMAATIRVNLSNHIYSLQAATGKQLNPEQIGVETDKFLSQPGTIPVGWWQSLMGQQPAPRAAATVSTLDPATVARARTLFAAHGVANPTNEQLTSAILGAQ